MSVEHHDSPPHNYGDTIFALLREYPALSRFAMFLLAKKDNPTVPEAERKEAELVLKDIRKFSLSLKRANQELTDAKREVATLQRKVA